MEVKRRGNLSDESWNVSENKQKQSCLHLSSLCCKATKCDTIKMQWGWKHDYKDMQNDQIWMQTATRYNNNHKRETWEQKSATKWNDENIRKSWRYTNTESVSCFSAVYFYFICINILVLENISEHCKCVIYGLYLLKYTTVTWTSIRVIGITLQMQEVWNFILF